MTDVQSIFETVGKQREHLNMIFSGGLVLLHHGDQEKAMENAVRLIEGTVADLMKEPVFDQDVSVFTVKVLTVGYFLAGLRKEPMSKEAITAVVS